MPSSSKSRIIIFLFRKHSYKLFTQKSTALFCDVRAGAPQEYAEVIRPSSERWRIVSPRQSSQICK